MYKYTSNKLNCIQLNYITYCIFTVA